MNKTQSGDDNDVVRIQKRGRALTVRLLGVIDVSVAEQLHQKSLRVVESGKNVVLDLAEAERLDASAVQVLLALRRELTSHGRSFTVAGESHRVREYLEMAGVAESLTGSPDAAAGRKG